MASVWWIPAFLLLGSVIGWGARTAYDEIRYWRDGSKPWWMS